MLLLLPTYKWGNWGSKRFTVCVCVCVCVCARACAHAPHFLSLYWICYSTASVYGLVFLTPRHVWSYLPDQKSNLHPMHCLNHWIVKEVPQRTWFWSDGARSLADILNQGQCGPAGYIGGWRPGRLRGHCRGKELTCQCRRHKRDRFNPWVKKITWSRKWQPAPVFLPGKFHGQRSLAGYSPWGCRVGHDYAHMHTHTHTHEHTGSGALWAPPPGHWAATPSREWSPGMPPDILQRIIQSQSQ